MKTVTFTRDVRLNSGNVIPAGTSGTLLKRGGRHAVVEVSGETTVNARSTRALLALVQMGPAEYRKSPRSRDRHASHQGEASPPKGGNAVSRELHKDRFRGR